MKITSIFISLILLMLITSCGEDPMPPRENYNIDRIYSINLDGSNRKLITTGSDYSLLSNNKIIYIDDHKLYLCNSDGTGKAMITPANLDVGNYQLFSNDTKILLNIYYSPYLINIDGSELTPINWAKNQVFNYIAISPEGDKISYAKLGLYIINTDGSNQRQIKDTSNTFSFFDINFTYDANNVVYLQDFSNGDAQDLRLYSTISKRDISLYYGTNGNWARTYSISKWNTLLFSNGEGVNIMNLSNYSYTFLHSGGDAHFSNDSSKITFTNLNNIIYVMGINDNSIKQIQINLPKNYISNPILSLDEKYVLFQADTSWSVLIKSNNNIVY